VNASEAINDPHHEHHELLRYIFLGPRADIHARKPAYAKEEAQCPARRIRDPSCRRQYTVKEDPADRREKSAEQCCARHCAEGQMEHSHTERCEDDTAADAHYKRKKEHRRYTEPEPLAAELILNNF
jgi:hypothetical protein